MKQTYSASKTTPTFIGDFLSRDYLLPGGVKLNPADFPFEGSFKVTVGANAAQGATSITVAALPGALANGAVLDFGGAKFARLTAGAAAGATSLTVAALPTALVTNDVATTAGTSAKKPIVAGTRIGRTYSEQEAGTAFGAAVDGDDEIFIIAYDILDALENNDAEVLRKNTLVKVNLLPGWATETSTIKGKVRTAYQPTTGAGGAA